MGRFEDRIKRANIRRDFIKSVAEAAASKVKELLPGESTSTPVRDSVTPESPTGADETKRLPTESSVDPLAPTSSDEKPE